MFMYEIRKRLVDSRKVVGYVLYGSDGCEYKVSKDKVLELAQMDRIINAKYNRSTKGLIGLDVDLREIENIDIKRIESKHKNKNGKKTNYELAEEYKRKAQLLGEQVDMEFKYMANDRVKLVGLKGKSRRLVIPSFITDIKEGIFRGSMYNEVYINNSGSRKFNANLLFNKVYSDELKVRFKHPECIVNMKEMFRGCYRLKLLDIKGLDTRNVEDMNGMFRECGNLKVLDVSKFDTSKVTDMSYMFYGCKNLNEVDISNFDTSKVVEMSYMFGDCEGLRKLDISKWDVGNVVKMDGLFSGCESLKELDVSKFDTSKVVSLVCIFNRCNELKYIDISSWDVSKVKDMSRMFNGCKSLEEIDVSKWDVSSVKDMSEMFYKCRSLSELDVSKWDVSSVKDMSEMYYSCRLLGELDVSKWDVSKVVKMDSMFKGCESLSKLDVSKWETHRLRIVGDIFYNCKSLKSIDMSSWDISSVNSINNMFSGCDKLEYIVLGKVMGRDRVLTMESVFKGCKMLKEVDFSRFKNIYIGILKDIFNGCESIEEIDLSWIESSDSYISRDSMFKGCNKLKLVKVNTKSKLTIGRVLIFDDIDCEIEYYE